MTTQRRPGVAIVGVSVRVPRARTLDELAAIFEGDVDTVGPLPTSRFEADLEALPAERKAAFLGSFLDDVATFDAAFFGVSPLEARRMDPQQRLALEESWRALEDAGLDPRALKGSRTGVFVGSSNRDYALSMARDPAAADVFKVMGSALGMTSNRVSHFLDLRGPSFTLDTACSSSLVALHQALASLERRECDLALVGGVNLVTSPHLSLAFSRARMLSDDGRCKAFSADADGYGRGEAVVFLTLMRTEDAKGRRSYGEIIGSAVNQDGRTEVITAPNREAQIAVMKEALGGLSPSYVEAHGTGTPVGDRVEYEALVEVLGATPRERPCLVGTAKSYLGHSEPASGLVGIAKTLVAFHHERIARHRGFSRLAPGLVAAPQVLELPTRAVDWKRGPTPRIAGVSSFGFGGTNAHVVLREAASHDGQSRTLTRFAGKPYWKKLEPVAARSRPAPSASLDEVRATLVKQVAQVLSAEVAQVDPARPLLELGLDSLELFTLLQRVEAHFRVQLSLDAVLARDTTLDTVARLVLAGAVPQSGPFAPLAAEAGGSSAADRAAVAAYTTGAAHSKELAQRHRSVLADNRNVAGFRARTKELTFPIAADRASGVRIQDVDGTERVDLSMGFGVHLFGHAAPFLVEAVMEALRRGAPIGPQSPLAGEVAALMHELTGLERFAFTNSGTEGVMLACRLARAATGRDRVVIFEGAYHGTFDGLLGRSGTGTGSGSGSGTRPLTPGTTSHTVADLVVLPWNDPSALAWLEEHASSVAAILVEPVQSRKPGVQPREFLHSLRDVATRSGAALVFDEVITGFRCEVGGAQAHFDVRADLAIYGKVLGGGFPIGAVGGSARFLDRVDGGTWRFGDDSAPRTDLAFFAGTFCKHPVAMATAKATLERLRAEPGLLTRLNETTRGLCERLNAAFTAEGLPLEAVRFASLFRFQSVRNLDHFFAHLNGAGVFAWEGRTLFLSEAHDAASLAHIETAVLTAARAVFGQVERVSAAQERFLDLPKDSLSGHVGFAVRIDGALDATRFETALRAVLGRHEGLRVRFDRSARTVAFDGPPRWTFSSSSTATGLERTRFDVESGPLAHFQWSDGVFSGVAHGVLLDGYSLAVLLQSLARELEGTPELPPAQYRDYLAFLRERPDHTAFWRSLFPNGAPPRLFERVAKTSTAGRVKRLWQAAPLREAARSRGVTPFMFLFTAFAHALEARDDFAIAVPFADRRFPGGERIVGNLTQLLAVPQPQGLSFDARLQVNASLLPRCYEHPGGHVVDPQVLFNLEPMMPLPRLAGASLTELDLPRPEAKFPLAVHVLEGADTLRFDFDFLEDVLTREQVEAIADAMERLP